MADFSDEDQEYEFFDAEEASLGDSSSDGSNSQDLSSEVDGFVSTRFQYQLWIRSPESVCERRQKFQRCMGSSLEKAPGDNFRDVYEDEAVAFREDMARILKNNDTVLRTSNHQTECADSCGSTTDSNSSKDLYTDENFVCRCGGGGRGIEDHVDDLPLGCNLQKLGVVSFQHMQISGGFEDSLISSPMLQHLGPRESQMDMTRSSMTENATTRWLSRLRSMTCIASTRGKEDQLRLSPSEAVPGTRIQRIKVRQSKKRLKELSALFKGQEIQAHEGSILTMKFSHDGRYLASAGEDKIIRIWQVVQDERSDEIDIPDMDPSCVYFTVNHLSQLAPILVDREKIGKLKSLRKTSDSACVIFPPNVFRIQETPIHLLRGHSSEILDLSWSKSDCLLSASTDKTVRLWKIGSDQCLKVFRHSNYVTCIQFNPLDDDYFISGSIDGKIRIWAADSCQVVDWTDIKDIVTAVSYHPEGQGGIIGSMAGTCRFFSISDSHMQLEEPMYLTGKKKSPCKRITGFQFLPQDPNKVMVTCADSTVRVLHGTNVIGKFKGLRSSAIQTSAFFTSDGKHIVSASEDSNVYMWDFHNREESSPVQTNVVKSFECFSSDASIAIPWSGLRVEMPKDGCQLHRVDENPLLGFSFSSSTCFSLGQELECLSKGSATWPEEKLPASSPPGVQSTVSKSHFKFLRTSCQNSVSNNAWGMVIVTAGYDGRIRSFHNYGLPVAL